jgi:CheY-like chemotaxis protein
MANRANTSSQKSEAEPLHVGPDRVLTLLWGYAKLTALVAIIAFALVSWSDVRKLIPRISRFEALGVKLEVSQLQNALEKQAQSVSAKGVVLQPGAIEAALARALHVQPVFQGATILWVDDEPKNNLPFRQVLRTLGAGVEPARSTQEALDLAASNTFDLVVSDIRRGNENGVNGIVQLRTAGVEAPAIFYVIELDRSRPVPDTALGITNRPDELLHLVIDGLERVRWSTPDIVEQTVPADRREDAAPAER